jgi:hypothetical protein
MTDESQPPTSSLSLSNNVSLRVSARAVMTLTPAQAGTAVISNQDGVAAQALAIELHVNAIIERTKDSVSLAELEAIRDDVHALRLVVLSTAEPPPDAVVVGAKALAFRDALINLWNKENESILKEGLDVLKISYITGLFFLGLGLIEHFGVLNAAIMATIIRPKEIPEVLRYITEIMRSLSDQSRD